MEERMEIALPTTGELVDLGNPEACAAALDAIREMEFKVKDFKRVLTEVLVDESIRMGSKTLRFGPHKVVIKERVVTIWDMEVLEQLLDAGLPQERFNDLVKAEVTYKVDKNESKRISAVNPVYAEIIDAAKREESRGVYAEVVP
jgi:hypothetical protein